MKYARRVGSSSTPLSHFIGFDCLSGEDVITGKISDHYPVIHDGVFFWNVMMQCKMRGGGAGFNNGLGLIETDEDYVARLVNVAQVIAEAVERDPSIEVITLCEGPVKPEHVDVLFHALMTHGCMDRFMMKDMFHKPASPGQNWGLLMLADVRYAVTKIRYDAIEDHPKLANRFQLWKLEETEKEKYIALAHFPFAGDEYKTDKMMLSASGQEYCGLSDKLIERYRNDCLVFCGDFNFNPYLISQWKDRVLDHIAHNNSMLLTLEGDFRKHIKTVTVDGILLSAGEKQQYHALRAEPRLIEHLKSEHRFFQSQLKQALRDVAQQEHDKQYALVPYHSS